MARFIQEVFFKGAIAILPVALTIYLIVWLASAFESLFGNVLEYLLPAGTYLAGMGFVVGLALIFAVGLMLQIWFTRRLWELGERMLDKMPLARSVFGALKQVMSYVSGTEEPAGSRVVMVSLGDPAIRMMGMVTRESLNFVGAQDDDEAVAVFLPWSYQIGGFTVFVPRSSIVRVDLSPQEALRFVMTAGVAGETSAPKERLEAAA